MVWPGQLWLSLLSGPPEGAGPQFLPRVLETVEQATWSVVARTVTSSGSLRGSGNGSGPPRPADQNLGGGAVVQGPAG